MPDFAPNYTARYRIRYTSLGKTHSMTWRVASTVTDPAGIAAKVGLFLADLEPILWNDWTLVGADFALADSDVFLPAVVPDNPSGAVSTSGSVSNDAAISLSFVGRSTAGLKARMFIYGTDGAAFLRVADGQDFRLTSTEEPAIADAVVRLNETSPAIVANDDAVATFYEYVNIKYNDRWLRRFRRG